METIITLGPVDGRDLGPTWSSLTLEERQEQRREHVRKWPMYECQRCEQRLPYFGGDGAPDLSGGPCPFCSARGNDGRVIEPRGQLRRVEPAELYPQDFPIA